jgi:hypothetical protein
VAQALAIEEQVRAYGGPRYQLTQQVMARFAEAIQEAGVDIVPKVVIGHDGRDGSATDGSSPFSGSGNVLEALLAILLSDRLGIDVSDEAATSTAEPSAAARVIRDELQKRIEPGQAA